MGWGLFFLLWFSFSYFHQPWTGVNQVSRLDLLHAVFKEGRLEITTYHQNTMDKAVKDNRYFSDKAPGAAALAAPAFGAAALGLKLAGTDLDSSRGWLVSSWVGCAGSQALLGAAGGVALFFLLRGGVSAGAGLVTALGLSLGSLPMMYATTLFSHAAVAGLLGVAVWAVGIGSGVWGLGDGEGKGAGDGAGGGKETGGRGQGTGAGGVGREWLAGFCCGWAIASEYSAALVCGGLLWLAWERGGWLTVWRVAWGAVPALLLIPAYHWACFGSPFTLAYGHEAVLKGMNRGLYGITFPPELGNAFEMLFSPARGIFLWTPLLGLLVVGYPVLFARSRRAFWLCYGVPVVQVVVLAGYYDPMAGGTMSARYLAPVLPLLAVPLALGVERLRRVGWGLLAVSVGLSLSAAALGLALQRHQQGNPWGSFFWPAWAGGNFNSNLGAAVGLQRYWVLAPLLVVWVVVGGWLVWVVAGEELKGSRAEELKGKEG